MNQVMNSPQLRFSEYQGKWESRKLEKYILEHKGGAPLKPSDFVRFSKCEVIPKKAITGGGKLLLDLEKATYCSEEFFKNYKNSIVDNSFLITTLRDLVPSGPNIGFIVKNESKSKYMLAQGVYGLKINTKELIEDFLIQLSNTSKYRKVMQTLKVGSTQVHIRNSIFFGIDVVSPSLPEQQKIADFFSAVDEKLQALKKKKELLEQYKKGLMEKIFSREIRFKDENGNNFPDWEEKKLGEISEKVMYGINAAAKSFDGKNKYLRITDIDENTRKFVPNPLSSPNGKLFDKFKLRERDLIFTRTGASVGKSYLYNIDDGDLYFAGFLIKFSIINSNPYFIYIQTLSEKYDKWVKIMSMRSGQPGINAEEYKTFPVYSPSISEQNCIAKFISTINDKECFIETQIYQTEQWKKGLLQKMFV